MYRKIHGTTKTHNSFIYLKKKKNILLVSKNISFSTFNTFDSRSNLKQIIVYQLNWNKIEHHINFKINEILFKCNATKTSLNNNYCWFFKYWRNTLRKQKQLIRKWTHIGKKKKTTENHQNREKHHQILLPYIFGVTIECHNIKP